MATRYAVANGNWSATATWDGGTTVPGAADDVYANNRIVTINQNVTVLSLRTTSGSGITAGGRFDIPSGSSFNVTATNGFISGSSIVLQVLGSGTRVITGNATGSSTTSTIACIAIQGSASTGIATVTYNGNLTGGAQSNSQALYIWGGYVTVNGSVTGGTASTGAGGINIFNSENLITQLTVNNGPITGGSSGGGSTSAIGVSYSPTGSALANSFINLNCPIYGGFFSTSNYGHAHSSTIPLTITGNVYGAASSSSNGVYLNGVTATTITGSVNGGMGTAVYQNAGGTLTVNGNVTAGVNGAAGITHANNSATTNVNGNVTGGAWNNSWGIYVAANGTVNIAGNVYGGSNGSEPYGIYSLAGATITVTGNVYGGTGGSTPGGIRIGGGTTTGGTLVVNGDVFGSDSPLALNGFGVYLISNGSITVNGTSTAGSAPSAHGAYNQAGGTLIVRKAKGNNYGYNSSSAFPNLNYAMFGLVQTSVLSVEEIELGEKGLWPIFGPVLFTDTSTNKISLRLITGGLKTLVTSNATGLLPATSNVRSGVTYNSGSSVGTMAVPAANSVAAGVAVDNTVGTAVLTQANVWDYALSSASSVAGSVGEKLKKTAIPADIIALG